MEDEDTVTGPDDGGQPAHWHKLLENVYLNERKSSKDGKRDNKMQCDCEMFYEDGEPQDGCGEDCINRLLMIECNMKLCPCGEFCQNQRFQKRQYAPVETFKAGMKGWGLRAQEDIAEGSFIREYVGEVCSNHQFMERSEQYHEQGRRHHYFMTLRTSEIIDATIKGSISRFINHSCEPNCETQKWTVNGRLRVGFFSIAAIPKGGELTFDYQFQRSGEGAQPCFCGAETCRGIIGGKQDRLEKGTDKIARTSSKKIRLVPEEDELTLEIKRLRKGSRLGVSDPSHILPLSRLMVTADLTMHRLLVLETLLATNDERCLKMFMKLQGLSLLWSWMVDCEDETMEALASAILDVLAHLPIANLNPLLDSKVLSQVKRWSTTPVCRALKPVPVGDAAGGDSGLPSTPVKTVAEPSSLCNSDVTADDVARHMTSADDTLAKSPSSSPEAKRTPSNGDSGVESPGGSGCSRGSVCENAAPSAETMQAPVQTAAQQLLEKWSDLKEVYRIPKKAPATKEDQPKPVPPPDSPVSKSSSAKSQSDLKLSRWSRAPKPPPARSNRNRHLPPKKSSVGRWDSPVNNSRRADPTGAMPFLARPTCPIVEAVIKSSQRSSSGSGNETGRLNVATASPGSVGECSPPHSHPNYPYPVVSTAENLLALQSFILQQQQQVVATAVAVASSRLSQQLAGQASAAQPFRSVVEEDPGTPLSSRGEEEDMVLECGSDGSVDIEASPLNLPTDWMYARDGEGRLYYYHLVSREPQWERPDEEFQPPLPTDSGEEDEPAPPPEELSAPKPAAQEVTENGRRKSSDSSSAKPAAVKRRRSSDSDRPAKKSATMAEKMGQGPGREFRDNLSVVVIQLLNPYRKADCKQGRIESNDDFKHLARKLTHCVVEKELQRKSTSHMEVNDSVRAKTTAFIRSYMKKFDAKYVRS